MIAASFQSLLQGFFTERLLRQRQASPHTIAGYRDTFRLLLRFAADQLGKAPSLLKTEDFAPAFIGRFLEHLEQRRGNSSRTRNARLAAIHSFFRYVAFTEPAHALLCQQVLAMPSKRDQRKPIAFLDGVEITAVLATPDLSTWIGRRDRTLLAVAIQTGLRVSELIGLRREDVVLGSGAHVRCEGKGRNQRCTPLGHDTAAVLETWLRQDLSAQSERVFPSIRGRPLSRDAVEELVARHAQRAQQACPSLKQKTVSPHVLRHSSAMRLRAHGVDPSVIALWLGHESVETTQMYLHADLRLKEQALSRVEPLGVKPSRYRPADHLLRFLESL
jgi:site-specific recombinase XerD